MRLATLLPGICVWSLVAACGGAGDSDSDGDGSTEARTTGADSTTADSTTADSTTADSTTADSTTAVDPTSGGDEPVVPEPAVLTLMEKVVFYDGYAAPVDEPVPDGVVRHSNSLYAVKLSEDQRASIQTTLQIGVIVGALCDNYDRIGSVHLALVPKGAATYLPADVQRIELARFITPFMNMNKSPKSVPYEYDADNVVPILKDEDLLAQYDLWFELSIFGVPYAANTEIAGCDGRNDTQLGTLLLHTDSTREPEQFGVLLPIAIGESFNDYEDGASDEVGTTRKTREFELAQATPSAQLVLITSNHGANEGGEEYIRREHYVYFDGALALQYRPGRPTCEPFRKYNTQGNGIYGPFPRTDEEWQSFSNWCPGDVIDTRIIPLGPVAAGAHEFVLDVPEATFVDGQGNFPFSLYLQAQ